MKVRWIKFCTTVGFWLFCEIWLNVVGLDDLADYSEFLFVQDLELERKNSQITNISTPHFFFCEKVHYFCPILEFNDRQLNGQFKNQPLHQFRIIQTFERKCKTLKNPCMRLLSLSDLPDD
jgi:hypothetical protein